jgi:DNA topoisomerase-1
MKTLTLEEALAVLAQPRKFGRRTAAQSVLATLGQHPDSGATITVRSGRFGPYVTDGAVNASVPKGREPGSLTLQDALDLIAAREEKLRAEGKDPRAAKPARARSTRSTSSRGRSTGRSRSKRTA